MYVRPSGAGLENVNFEEYTFILDIHCQQLGNMCQLNIYICIGYILPTIGGCDSWRVSGRRVGEHGLTWTKSSMVSTRAD